MFELAHLNAALTFDRGPTDNFWRTRPMNSDYGTGRSEGRKISSNAASVQSLASNDVISYVPMLDDSGNIIYRSDNGEVVGYVEAAKRFSYRTSGEGLVTEYFSGIDGGGVARRSVYAPTGDTYMTVVKRSGITTVTDPDGTATTIGAGFDAVLGVSVGLPSTTVTLPSTANVAAQSVSTTMSHAPSGTLDVYATKFVDRVTSTTFNGTLSTPTATTVTPANRTYYSTFDSAGHVLNVSEAGLPSSGSSYLYTQPGSPVVGLLSQIVGNGGTTQLSYYQSGATKGLVSNITRPDLSATDYVWNIGAGTQLTQVTGTSATAMAWDTMQKLASVTPPNSHTHGQGYDAYNLLGSYTTPGDSTVNSSTTTYTRNRDRQIASMQQPGRNPINYVYTKGRLNYLYLGAPPLQVGNTAIDWEHVATGSGQGHVSTITGPGPTTSTAAPLSFAASVPKITYTYNGYLPITEAWSGPVTGSIQFGYDTYLKPTTKAITIGSFPSTVNYALDADGMVTCASTAGTCGGLANDLKAQYNGPNLRLSNVTVGSTSEVLGYDDFGALASQTVMQGTTNLLQMTYAGGAALRDNMGRIKTKVETWPDATNHTFNYTYDPLEHRT